MREDIDDDDDFLKFKKKNVKNKKNLISFSKSIYLILLNYHTFIASFVLICHQ